MRDGNKRDFIKLWVLGSSWFQYEHIKDSKEKRHWHYQPGASTNRGGRTALRVGPSKRTKAARTTDRRITIRIRTKPHRSRKISKRPYEPRQTTAKYAKYATTHPNSASSIKPSSVAAATRMGTCTWCGCKGPCFPAPPMAAPPSLVSSLVRQPLRSPQRTRRPVRTPYEPRRTVYPPLASGIWWESPYPVGFLCLSK